MGKERSQALKCASVAEEGEEEEGRDEVQPAAVEGPLPSPQEASLTANE